MEIILILVAIPLLLWVLKPIIGSVNKKFSDEVPSENISRSYNYEETLEDEMSEGVWDFFKDIWGILLHSWDEKTKSGDGVNWIVSLK